MNRLAFEASPYLRQHRDNPVNWYPWGPEAFERARSEDKPILLSVGYSSCHWCHRMAHESFEDPDTAAMMNTRFVNVKVDREERPDVDSLYMDAVTAAVGRGGWPMTVFLTPDGKPFFAGTYYPKERGRGMPAFTEVLDQVDRAWRRERVQVLMRADDLTASLARANAVGPSAGEGTDELLQRATQKLVDMSDAGGGFGPPPKFPHPLALDALVRSYGNTGDPDAARVVTVSLDAMAAGGIYDHLGGGFARYAVDGAWMVPHFEKMLCDNALLARVYLHAWQVTGNADYRQVLDETIAYVLRDLGRLGGGFETAEDADSERVEGAFYVWEAGEIRELLGPEADEVVAWFGVTDEGNFEGRNVLFRPVRGHLARPASVERSRARLLDARNQRPRPGRDDKVLTEWNALMVATLAEAGAATGTRTWLEAAIETGDFLLANLRREDGRWLRSWQVGDGILDAQARHLACAADYAALVDAFVRLAEASGEARWIEQARQTADRLLDLFWDRRGGGVYTTGDDAESLVVRPKVFIDRATPSANSATAVSLLRLGALIDDDRYVSAAEDILSLVGAAPVEQPFAFAHLLAAADMLSSRITEIVIVGDRADLVDAIQARYLPNAVLAWGEPYDSPLWRGREDGRGYVCRNYMCRLPATDVDELLRQVA